MTSSVDFKISLGMASGTFHPTVVPTGSIRYKWTAFMLRSCRFKIHKTDVSPGFGMYFCFSAFLHSSPEWGTVGVPASTRRRASTSTAAGCIFRCIFASHRWDPFHGQGQLQHAWQKMEKLPLKQRHWLLLKTFHSCTSISRACKRQEVVWKDTRYWKSESQLWNIIVQTHKDI